MTDAMMESTESASSSHRNHDVVDLFLFQRVQNPADEIPAEEPARVSVVVHVRNEQADHERRQGPAEGLAQ
jgi:hypothetical protein